jgi:spermidine synthase
MGSGARRGPRSAVTLSEEDGLRYLHFGTEWIQGGMRIARPWQLELEYQKQMMAVALFVAEPSRIVQLGLGAAALTKFCYKNLPNARITAVEISSAVVDAAYQWFALPVDDCRLEVVLADARDYLGDRRGAGRADWLQVDLYDAAARGPVHDDPEFYAMCRRVLQRPGVACFNLFGGRFETSFAAIASSFGDRVLALPEVDEGNRIVFALNGPRSPMTSTLAQRRAKALEDRWKLPFSRWLADLAEANGTPDPLSI